VSIWRRFSCLVVKFWWLIVGVGGMFCVATWGRRAFDRHAARAEAQRRRLLELVARADEQHRLVMQGDEVVFMANFRPPQCDSLPITSLILPLIGVSGYRCRRVLTPILLCANK
jgi:hypothetical protein